MSENDDNILRNEIDVPQLLLHSRNLTIHSSIDENTSRRICEDLLALDLINNEPIGLWICSGGGSPDDGWAIIDTIFGLTSPVYTFIRGMVGSMASVVALAGQKRVMTENSTWMFHEIKGYGLDTLRGREIINRSEDFYKKMDKHTEKFILKRTKLTKKDLEKARNGELWLWPDECKKKGIVDVVVKKRRGK